MVNRKSWSLFFGLFLVTSIILSVYVSAETIAGQGLSWFQRQFGVVDSSSTFDQFLGQDNVLIAQFLIFLLVAVIVYAVSPFLPFFERRDKISIVFSFIVAALATFFLSAQEIRSVVLSYGALGLTLTAIIPFFAMIAISKKSYEKQHFVMSWVLWLFFIVFTAYRFLAADSSEIGPIGKLVMPIIFILSILMLFFQGKIYWILFKIGIKEGSAHMKEEGLAVATAELEEIADQIKKARDDASKNALIAKFNRLVKYQNDLGGNYKAWGS